MLLLAASPRPGRAQMLKTLCAQIPKFASRTQCSTMYYNSVVYYVARIASPDAIDATCYRTSKFKFLSVLLSRVS